MNYAFYVLGCLGLCGMFLGAGIYLVITEHYWWAWVPFFVLGAMEFKPPAAPKPPEPSRIIKPKF